MDAEKIVGLLIFLAVLGLGFIVAGIVLVVRKEKQVLADVLMSLGVLACYFPSRIFLGALSKLVMLVLIATVLVFAGIAGKQQSEKHHK